LVGACSGLFILMLDSTVVALALSSIRADVGADATQLQWVMNGYLLTIAVLVVTAGRLGDMFGRKRVFVLGMVFFGAGSVLSGAAQGPEMLIGGRVLQGVGAAPILSLSLAIVCNAFSAADQPRALGIWAAVSAIALAIGPVVGGLLIEVDWRLIFWINLPIVILGVAIVALAAPESTDPGAGRQVDFAGLLALAVGLGGVVLAMVQSREWPTEATALLAATGVLALASFALIERRVRNPIVEFALFRNGPYFGARGLMTAGMAFGTIGLVVLTQIGPHSSYGLLLVGYLLFGIAIGLVYAPMSTAAMAAMPAEKVGIASGVLAMDRIVAGSLALAATGAAFHALQAGGSSFSNSIAGSTWVAVVLCLIGAALTWAFVRDPEQAPHEPQVHARHRHFHL
jgi:Major Facilitator Superfamily